MRASIHRLRADHALCMIRIQTNGDNIGAADVHSQLGALGEPKSLPARAALAISSLQRPVSVAAVPGRAKLRRPLARH
jgi:hypothetical protein